MLKINFLLNKKKLFGNNINPRCDYCLFSTKNNDGNLVCSYDAADIDNTCKRYEYDPLKREPLSAPTLPKFIADDFKL